MVRRRADLPSDGAVLRGVGATVGARWRFDLSSATESPWKPLGPEWGWSGWMGRGVLRREGGGGGEAEGGRYEVHDCCK